jgi:hypothetical protein
MSGLKSLTARINYTGGKTADQRLINNKLYSFHGALKNAYQSVSVKIPSQEQEIRCLLNPDKITLDYDNKIISIDNSAQLKAGDVFQWVATSTHWIVYLQDLNETAYFRAYVRQCRYTLTIGSTEYYIYVQGPTETKVPWNQKDKISWNSLNYTLVMFITQDSTTLDYFKRFVKVKFNNTTWEVEAVDTISTAGIIQVNLVENFTNTMEEAQIAIVPAVVDTTLPHIIGDSIVKPYDTPAYTIALTSGGTWSINNSKAKILSFTDTSALVEITSAKQGTFTLSYSVNGSADVTLPIIIESL